MTHSHYNKWTNQFIDECSAFTPSHTGVTSSTRVFTERNKYQIGDSQQTAYSSYSEMPQQYRNYAHSLSNKRSTKKSYDSFGMYNYLKSLSFVKNRHKQNCSNQCLLKKKTRKEVSRCESKPQLVFVAPAPVHTVERVYVQSPPVHIHHQPIMNVQNRNIAMARSASAPRVAINYISPANINYQHYNSTVNRQRVFVNQRPPLVNSQPPIINQNSVILIRNPVQAQQQLYSINVLPVQQVVKDLRPKIESSCVSQNSPRLFESKTSNSFRVEPANMEGSELLAFTFKQIRDEH